MVCEAMETQDAQTAPHHTLIRTRWAMCNKGDGAHPEMRARLVACETNTDYSQAFFASAPPLEALKVLFSEFSSRKWHTGGSALQVSFIDIRNAYSNPTPTRNVCLAFPKSLDFRAVTVATYLYACMVHALPGYCGKNVIARFSSNSAPRGALRRPAALSMYVWAYAWSYMATTLPAQAPRMHSTITRSNSKHIST